MPTQAINSPFIKSVSLIEDRLTIEFKNGSRYRYFGIPTVHYLGLCRSILPGRYYTERIKGKYSSKKLEAHEA